MFILSVLSHQLMAQGITIKSGTTITGGSAAMTLPGNWSNSGTFTAGTSTVLFNGASGNQTITNSSGETFNNLTVNKAGGDVQLSNNITANGTLTLTSGDVDLNGNIITLGSSATLSETAGNTVKGTTGIITTTRLINAPSSNNIGGMGAELTSSADLGSTIITRGHTAQTGSGNTGITRYFDITPTNNSSLTASLVFRYDDSELNALTESELILFKSTDVGINWTQMGGTLNITSNTATLAGLDGFSRWTLGASSLAAEILIEGQIERIEQLVNTGVLNHGQGNALITKLNGALQKLAQGKTNAAVNKLKSFRNQVNGFINGGVLTPVQGQPLITAVNDIIDLINNGLPKKGNDDTSPEIPTQYTLGQNYPNPFNPTTTIIYGLPEDSPVVIKIYDVLGAEIIKFTEEYKSAGYYKVNFDASSLPSGIYFYRIQAGDFIEIKKMVLLK